MRRSAEARPYRNDTGYCGCAMASQWILLGGNPPRDSLASVCLVSTGTGCPLFRTIFSRMFARPTALEHTGAIPQGRGQVCLLLIIKDSGNPRNLRCVQMPRGHLRVTLKETGTQAKTTASIAMGLKSSFSDLGGSSLPPAPRPLGRAHRLAWK